MRAKKVYGKLDFERGQNPYKVLNIGKYRIVKKGDKILIYYRGRNIRAIALTDEEIDTRSNRHFIDFEDEQGDKCWAVRSIEDFGKWFVPSANENIL